MLHTPQIVQIRIKNFWLATSKNLNFFKVSDSGEIVGNFFYGLPKLEIG